ncbi:OprO/OprP family phosphate-selective porin [Aquabacterium sp. A7-Y]|uniref:hypothetical protein n=1 Tax=Aquabacterium sp. A7-Y TaxID=1349605 RepID=UPI00223D9C08|nr:hypothetical protein [Aquabacterium sp. A7-Y]MCW7540176.1 OprO/OprP family phosphate-selective porin [Aquabacterium sp. A7-Y]
MKRVRACSATRAAAAGLLAVAASASQAVDPATEQLRKEVQALREELQALKAQLAGKVTAAAARATPPGDEAAVPGEADTGAQAATKADVEGLRSDLENYKYESQRNRETKTALTTRGTRLGGSVQARFTHQDPGVASGSTAAATRRHSSFDISQATVNLSGSLYRDYAEGRDLDYRAAFAYAANTPANNNSQFNLTDAYLQYSPVPTKAGLEAAQLTLRLGQQQIPFGLEAQVGEELRPVIQSAQFLSTLGVGTRQIGLILRGDLEPYVDYGFNYRAPLLEYALGIVNGSGPNKSDDNGDKDYLARLAFTLPVDYYSLLRELKVGTSYYQGRRNLTRTVAGATSTAATGDSTRAGFDIYYNHAPFGVTYEYAEGRDEVLVGSSGTGLDTVKSRGQYLTLFYTWGEQWVRGWRGQAKYDDWWPKSYQAFVRHDLWDPDRAVARNSIAISTLGLNVFFAETTKFQVNLSRTGYQDPALDDSDAVLLQFQYGF